MRSRTIPVGILALACASALIGGCRSVAGPARTSGDDVDLALRLQAEGKGGALRRHVDVTRRGRRADAAVLIAPVSVRASLAGLSGRYILRISAAPVFNVGDGMQMDLAISDSRGRRDMVSRYFDAGRKAADRAWIPIEVPLALSGGGDVYLDINVSGGPQGDLVADWLAFAEIVMVRAKDKR